MFDFQNAILQWFTINQRELPWRKNQNPYYIWLSEVILQQTRIDQGTQYFLQFVKTFPTVHDLANASEQDVLLLWQGLGYYSRARNMHHTAQTIVAEHGGVFPDSYDALLKLKGIGPYSAAAIASIAFDLEHAVVDGNVYRVLSRFFGIHTPIDSTEGKKQFFDLANRLIHQQPAGMYNQALMEFGALQCKPAKPNCHACPVQSNCVAFKSGWVKDLPIKSKKAAVRRRIFHYYIPIHHNQTILFQRGAGDIWQGLWEFPMLEVALDSLSTTPSILPNQAWIDSGFSKLHKLTHQTIEMRFFVLPEAPFLPEQSGVQKVDLSDLHQYPFPIVLNEFIAQVLPRIAPKQLE
jgi:A/G-specific adenine glycosylase